MRKLSRAASFAFIGLLAGCGGGGGPSSSDPGTAAPHNGKLITLPDGDGFVEVVKKTSTTPNTPTDAEVSFYFFRTGSTPYTPAPTSGTLALPSEKKIMLKAEGGALVTPPGPVLFAKSDVDGALIVELNGKTKTIALGIR